MEKTANDPPPALLEHSEEQADQDEPTRVRLVEYHGYKVTLYEIDGKEYMTGEDIGICLGMGDPRKSVNKIL